MAEEIFLTVTMEDDGVLPENTVSPYRYFVSGKNFSGKKKNPLFCNALRLPPLWEVREAWIRAEIYNARGKQGDIAFFEPLDDHFVKTVTWLTPAGRRDRVDHYDLYGCLYCTDYFYNDTAESRTYFGEDGREVATIQPRKDTVTLIDGGEVRVFPSTEDFLQFFYAQAERDGLKLTGK